LTGNPDNPLLAAAIRAPAHARPARRIFYPRPLIFIHLPKAGGTTLMGAIIARYRAGRGFRFTGLQSRTEEFKALPPEERAKFDIVHGHVHFGIHKWLPDPAIYATMLRDPVDRIISHYYFVKASPEHYLHDLLQSHRWSLEQYATEGVNWETDNDQVRWLTEAEHSQVPLGQVSRSLLEEAKWNLQNAMTAFGLVERFDESLECFRRSFGWPDLTCERVKNVNTERPRSPLPQRTIDAIRRTNRWDVELYEFACELFERQLLRLRIHAAPDAPAQPRIVITARQVVEGQDTQPRQAPQPPAKAAVQFPPRPVPAAHTPATPAGTGGTP
jgi:hypothetical protein